MDIPLLYRAYSIMMRECLEYLFLFFYFLQICFQKKTMFTILFLKTLIYQLSKIISIKQDLTMFYKKKIPYNWTVYAPSNKAFENTPKELEKLILKDNYYSKRLFTDHILTKEILASDFTEQITTEVTVSNKPIKLYRSENLFVKDVVVVKEDIIAENGVIHIIDCIMFIQPSFQDSRLSPSQKDSFPITSCCMQTEDEILLWKQNTKKIVY